MMRLFAYALGFMFFVSSVTQAARIAVIDSGVDYKHKMLTGNIWKNPNTQTVDADGTVYKDDTYGWNFAEKNNQVIDYKYLGTFSPDCRKVFEVQAKVLEGTATKEEQEWYTAKKKDATFLKELQKFGNFVHGTHVSGISSHEAGKSSVVALKIIPTETPGQMVQRVLEMARRNREANPIAKFYLSFLAKQQANMLIPAGKYAAAVKAEVANGSFGASVTSVEPVIKQLLSSLLGKEPTEAELREYAVYFVNEMATASKAFVGASTNTLFVFAAGNDGKNNDELPVSPANIKADNTISVAATLGEMGLASFSNYGATMVEVAAPGVAILSTIPGDETLKMSGTSMAAPFVTNVAGLVKDANSDLSPMQIKKILMETVDMKAFLSGKVKSGGIVNRDRAVKAAEMAKDHSLDDAIRLARVSVLDVMGDGPRPFMPEILFVPMPDLFN